jgi:adenosine deaminase
VTVAQTKDAFTLRELAYKLPKIELHRHLEGSIRLTTLAEVARAYQLEVPGYTPEALRPHVQILTGDPATVEHFLSKFAALRKFYCAPEVLRRIAYEAIEDAAKDNIKYLELRFTPRTLARTRDFALEEVCAWVCEAAQDASQKFNMRVRLIASINRHEGVAEAEKVARAAVQFQGQGIVALDLAGQEDGYPAKPFAGIFREAQQAGLGLTIHAGEWAGPLNVKYAIERLGATRIGHGVRIVENDTVVRMARERGTVFEVCPTSNVHSGVVGDMTHHPLRDMAHLNLRVTLNADDPGISDITLSHEFQHALHTLQFAPQVVKSWVIAAAEASFLPTAEREALLGELQAALEAIGSV